MVFPKASIIISNRNGCKLLRACLTSLAQLDYPNYEVIVVDADSTDGSPDMVRNHFPWVTLICEKEMGIGEAINIGIKNATGEIIIFDLNNDDVVEKSWLKKLVEVLQSSDEIGIVGGKRLSAIPGVLDSTIGVINFITGNIRSIGKSSYYRGQFEERLEVDFVSVIATKQEVIGKAGFVDDDYKIYLEDVDYCVTVKKLGYKVVYTPEAVLWHARSATIGRTSLLSWYFNRRNQLRFIFKQFPLITAPLSFLIRSTIQFVMDIIVILPGLQIFVPKSRLIFYRQTRGNAWYLLSTISAIAWNLRNLRHTVSARYSLAERIEHNRINKNRDFSANNSPTLCRDLWK